jgi:uncharacterized protein (TIGR02598 family)
MQSPAPHGRTTTGASTFLRRLTRGFTLVEVTLSMGVISVAMVSVLGLLPVGLTTFRQAMTNTVESQIVQGLSNDVLLTNFDNLQDLAGEEYDFDNDGRPIKSGGTAGNPRIYTARMILRPMNNPQRYPVNLRSDGARDEAYDVQIEITNHSVKGQKTLYSVIVADNNI